MMARDHGGGAMSQVRDLMSWLQREASRCAEPGALLMAVCQRLVAAGVPVHGATLTIATLHPLIAGSTFAWHRDRGHALEAPRLHPMSGHASALPSRDRPGMGRWPARPRDRVQRRGPPKPGRDHRASGIRPCAAHLAAQGRRPAGGAARDSGGAADRLDPAHHLSGPPQQWPRVGGRGQARRRRDHQCRALVLRPARLHHAVRSPATGSADRLAERAFRAAGRTDQGVWRRGPEIHGRWPAGDLSDRDLGAERGL